MLSQSIVKQLAAKAADTAAAIPCPMSIVFVDSGANLVYAERMDDALIAGVEVAARKARSAVLYKRPTKAFEEMLAGGRMAILTLPDAMPLEGGIPLLAEGRLVGAIGVSGGTARQDGHVAAAAADLFGTLTEKIR